MKFIKQLFCEHQYRLRGVTFVECPLCHKIKRDPELTQTLLIDYCKKKVDAGELSETLAKMYLMRGGVSIKRIVDVFNKTGSTE